MNQYLSDLDTNRFGVLTVKADAFDSEEQIEECFSFCKKNDAALLIARTDASNTKLTHAMERHGALLCDTLVYYEVLTRKALVGESDSSEITIREINQEDREIVIKISKEAFSGYFGHYHSDPKLNRQDCDDTYVSWCESILKSADPSNKILVAEDAAGICGFLTMRVHDDRMELVLSGVDQRAVGRGVYRRMIHAGVKFALDNQFKRVFTSTQISNIAVQKVWCGQGFTPIKHVHTFHKWF